MGDVKSLKSLKPAGNVIAKSLLSLLFSIPESLADILDLFSILEPSFGFVYFYFHKQILTLTTDENENV